MRRSFLPLIFAGLACTRAPSSPPVSKAANVSTTDAEELAAFARLYGAVRFFHPSDAAAAADWNSLAIAGARAVVIGSDRAALRAALQGFVDPIAPTVRIYAEHEPAPELSLAGDGPMVAWQHLGGGFEAPTVAYQSVRIGRMRTSRVEGAPYGTLLTELDPKPLRGKRVRVEGRLRVEDAFAALVVMLDSGGGEPEILAFANDQPLSPGEWATQSIEVTVPEREGKLMVGGVIEGEGVAWFDDLRVTVVEGERPVALQNPGFEVGFEGWSRGGDNFEYAIADEGGSKVAKIRQLLEQTDAPLFEATPEPGEIVDLELGAGLRVRLPVALASSLAAVPAPVELAAEANDPSDPAVRAAAVIAGWSVLRHFYPYFDVIGEDWEEVLDASIADVLDDRDAEDLRATLERMVAKLHDGHGNVLGGSKRGYAAIELARIEGKVIVTAAAEGSGAMPGDELVSVDGVAIADAYAEASTRVSGSPQWIEVRLLRSAMITAGPPDQPARLELRRGEEVLSVELPRDGGRFEPTPARPAIERLADGVYYVDLSRAAWAEIAEQIDAIAAAPGVVFDLRGYPNNNHEVLEHLLREPDATKWTFVPQILYPNMDRIAGWSGHDWAMQPAEPHIGGRVVFVTDARAVSYAESIMGLVEGLKLGEIVGTPTAGANGNINPFTVPGGFRLVFTGMKVTRLDGRRHHAVGVLPTIPAAPTIAGIRAGRDEVLERALEVVRGR